MKKITIICGTNRRNSYTEKVSNYYHNLLQAKGVEVKVLSLRELENIITLSDYFNKENPKLNALISEYITPSQAFVFIIPEYNGSYPGIMKLFLDTVHPSHWNEKMACITGVAGGRAGNLRGMDQLTGVLNYLKMHVYHNKLPISQIDKIFAEGAPNNEETKVVINRQIEGFLKTF